MYNGPLHKMYDAEKVWPMSAYEFNPFPKVSF